MQLSVLQSHKITNTKKTKQMVQDHNKKLLLAVLSSVSQAGETRALASCAKGTCTRKHVVCLFSTFTLR